MRRLALLAVIGLSSCIGARQVAASTRVEYGVTRGDLDPDHGTKDYSNDSHYVAVSISPLAFLEPPREVIVVHPEGK